MNDLYPHLNSRNDGGGGKNGTNANAISKSKSNKNNYAATATVAAAGIGSFDDYDSIIDGVEEFSIGRRTADSDDVSSMMMSEMGGASVAMAAAAAGGGGDNGGGPVATPPRKARAYGAGVVAGAAAGGGGAEADVPSPARSVRWSDQDDDDPDAQLRRALAAAGVSDSILRSERSESETGSESQPASEPTLPTVDAAMIHSSSALEIGDLFDGMMLGNEDTTAEEGSSTLLNLQLETTDSQGGGSDNHSYGSGYYHVGDMGLDSGDVSAILGVGSEDTAVDGTANDAKESTGGGERLYPAPDPYESEVEAGGANANDGRIPSAEGDDGGDRHSLPSADEVRNYAALKSMYKNASGDVEDQRAAVVSGRRKRQLGPLGDEMSYASGGGNVVGQSAAGRGSGGGRYGLGFSNRSTKRTNNKASNGLADHNDGHWDHQNSPNVSHASDAYNFDDEYYEDEGFLPHWISASSGRAKCLLISSVAVAFGAMVLVAVMLGVSYGAGGSDNNGGGGSVGTPDRAEAGGGSDAGLAAGAPTPAAVPTMEPTEWQLVEEPDDQTAYPTYSPFLSGAVTTTNEPTVEPTVKPTADPTPGSITSESLEVADAPPAAAEQAGEEEEAGGATDSGAGLDLEASNFELELASEGPSAQSSASMEPTPAPTHIPSMWPSALRSPAPSTEPTPVLSEVPTASFLPTSSAIPTSSPSSNPTISSSPTSTPSTFPTGSPSLVPSSSSAPSWSFGNDALDEGDVMFYLIGDGGSNWKFWSDKMETLPVEGHEFVVHL